MAEKLRLKLTKAAIDRLEYDPTRGGKHIVWDTEVKGFGIRLWPTGKKVFVVNYRTADRQERLLTLGPYGVLTPHDGRERALRALADAGSGRDPLGERQRLARGDTVADLARLFIADHASKKASARDISHRVETFIVAAWGNRKVTSITRRDVIALHNKIGAVGYQATRRGPNGEPETFLHAPAPVQANRVLADISVMWNKARFVYEFKGVDDRVALENPAEGVQKFPEKKRRVFVTKEEMPRLAAAISAEDSLFMRAYLWFRLLTGLRPGAARELRWDQVDLANRQLVLEDTKGSKISGEDRTHFLPLSDAALELLRRVPRLMDNDYVFCGARKGCPLVNYAKPWNRIKKAAEIEHVRPHDLRRTVGSWIAQSGGSIPLIGAVLDQTTAQVTEIYARFHQDPVAKAFGDHARELAAAAGGKFLLSPSDKGASSIDVASEVD